MQAINQRKVHLFSGAEQGAARRALPADWSSGGSLDVLSLQSGAFDPLGNLLRLTAALGRAELAEAFRKFRL
jgi:hypothetical protein